MDKNSTTYVEVLLPLAIPQTYTYAVPIELVEKIGFGLRVEVPLKNKLISGLIIRAHQDKPISKTRNIISLLDDQPIIQEIQFEFWVWIASYYLCNLGEVMSVALPGGLKLSSETTFVFHPDTDLSTLELTDDEHLIAEALSIQHEMNIGLIQDILDKKTVLPLIKRLMQKRVISVKEELRAKYKVLMEDYIAFVEHFGQQIEDALALTSRSEKQSRAVLGLGALSRKTKHVAKKALYEILFIICNNYHV